MTLQFLSPIHRAVRQVALCLEAPMSRLGIRGSEGHLLTYLRAYAPCPVGELSRVFGWKGSTLTSTLDRLEDRDLLMRRPNPDDRRSLLVELTPRGLGLARRVLQSVTDLENRIRQGVSKQDLAGFRAVLSAIDVATAIDVRPDQPSREDPK